MDSEVRTTSVRILGRDYRIRTSADEAFVQEVARFVDGEMEKIAAGTRTGTVTQVAVLAALNIAEELFRERRGGDSREGGDEVEERLRAILSRLDEILVTVPAQTAGGRRRRPVSSS
jgi:cell division protein ZapA